jgi:thiamine monophosphate synthase
VYSTTSHPDLPGRGLQLITDCSAFGIPVIAIGGITGARAREVREAGAYGVAAISALWRAGDPALATLELLEPWTSEP